MASLTDHLNDVITNLQTNRAGALSQLAAMRKQLEETPQRLQKNIDTLEKAVAEMDAMIALTQVGLVNPAILDEVEAQTAQNSAPLPPAAGGGAAAGEASATQSVPSGDSGSAGVADQSAAPAPAPAGNSSGAAKDPVAAG